MLKFWGPGALEFKTFWGPIFTWHRNPPFQNPRSATLSCYQPQADDLGFPEFDYELPGLRYVVGRNLYSFWRRSCSFKRPPFKRFKHCAYAYQASNKKLSVRTSATLSWSVRTSATLEMCFSHQLRHGLEVTKASKLLQSPVHLLENYFSHYWRYQTCT